MLKNFLLNLINIYQGYIKTLFPPSCRFTPSCSDYAKQAIIKYGCIKGGFRAGKRLLLCHPLSGKAGYYPLE
jgi:putative membrane protein insertion efficiency factor